MEAARFGAVGETRRECETLPPDVVGVGEKGRESERKRGGWRGRFLDVSAHALCTYAARSLYPMGSGLLPYVGPETPLQIGVAQIFDPQTRGRAHRATGKKKSTFDSLKGFVPLNHGTIVPKLLKPV